MGLPQRLLQFARADLFGRPGYANFAITEPPLKLVLIEGTGDAVAPRTDAMCCGAAPESATRCC